MVGTFRIECVATPCRGWLLALVALSLAPQPVAARRPVRHAAPAKPPAPPRLPPAKLIAVVDAAPRDRAGKRRAGMLCLPNGKLRVRDFVPSDDDLQRVAERALRDYGHKGAALTADGVTFEIHLKSINASLCAHSWGFWGIGSNRSELSGKATVTFKWSLARPGNPREATSDILLELRRDDAATPVEIMEMAVERMLDTVVAGEAATAG